MWSHYRPSLDDVPSLLFLASRCLFPSFSHPVALSLSLLYTDTYKHASQASFCTNVIPTVVYEPVLRRRGELVRQVCMVESVSYAGRRGVGVEENVIYGTHTLR
ncbi:hypothetical protein VTJ04DRAFT_5214 [Mycothermus thermophilus]|uniref:uncharacterized protein n=1 Tax=Humicola insolens TaxID=85995 RepID=UPI003742BB36